MNKSHFIVHTYFVDCPVCDNGKGYCLERELIVESASEAILQAKELKTHKEIGRIIVLEKSEGYIDRTLYEFERGI